jgi:carboxypeptidase PM20D1
MLNVQLSVEVSPTEIGHASMPPPQTAISILATAIDRVQASPFPARIDGGLRDTLRFLAPEMPSFVQRFAMANLWLTEPLVTSQLARKPSSNALLRSTVAPTLMEGGVQVNVLPHRATATLNLRLIPGDSIEGAIQHIRQSIDDTRVDVDALPMGKEASPMSSIESTAFERLHRTIREVYPDVAVAPFVLVGSTDSVHYSDLAEDTYRFIPARIAERDTQRFHGIDERIALEDYARIVQFFHQLILNLYRPQDLDHCNLKQSCYLQQRGTSQFLRFSSSPAQAGHRFDYGARSSLGWSFWLSGLAVAEPLCAELDCLELHPHARAIRHKSHPQRQRGIRA